MEDRGWKIAILDPRSSDIKMGEFEGAKSPQENLYIFMRAVCGASRMVSDWRMA
jgi:hypothetical protein